MKRNIYKIIAICLAIISFCSCQKEHKLEELKETDYIGTISVDFYGTQYDTEAISVNVTPDKEKETLTISLFQIKFVPQMPITIDINIPDVAYTRANDGTVSFSGTDIIPLMGVVPVEDYKVSDLTGTIKGELIEFSLKFGSYPTSYTGTLNN